MKSFDADHSKLVEIKNDILFMASSKGDFSIKTWDIRFSIHKYCLVLEQKSFLGPWMVIPIGLLALLWKIISV